MDAQIQKHTRIASITETGGAGTGEWTLSLLPALGTGENRPIDVKIKQVTVVLEQGAGAAVPTWLGKVGQKLLVGLDINN
jgi:hypothetical protein